MKSTSERVVIGMDPHKRSATIEVMDGDETVLGGGRFGTDRAGYAAMVAYAKRWPVRVWAVEGCQGIGRHIATRLLADGEQGSTLVRWAAVEAAQGARNAGWLTEMRTRIGARRGRNIATVAVARKLLTLVYYGLRDGHIHALDQARAAA